MAFTTTRKVRFSDVDPASIVFYPRFFKYFHDSFEDLFAHGGLSYDEILNVRRVGFPTVHAEADYKSPLRLGDEVEITVSTTRVGDKSATFCYECRRKRDMKVVCVGSVTIVCVNMETFVSMPFPDYLRTLFTGIAAT